jgi:hypothetical protein
MSTIKNDYETFESFVKQYPAMLELAKKYKRSPGMLLELFAAIGEEVLKKTNDKLINDLSLHTKNFLSTRDFKLSDDSIKALDGLIKFIKEKSEAKHVS